MNGLARTRKRNTKHHSKLQIIADVGALGSCLDSGCCLAEIVIITAATIATAVVIVLERETPDAVTVIVPIVRHTTVTAMVDGITDTAISTVVSAMAMAVHQASVIETKEECWI